MHNNLIIKIIITCVLIIGLDGFFQYEMYQEQKSLLMLETSYQLAKIRTTIEEQLTYNLLLAKGAASFVATDVDGITRERFEIYAENMLSEAQSIKNVSLAKEYTIAYVYPLKGNEQVVGLDYRTIPTQFSNVEKAAKSGSMVIDGPLRLVPGGIGIIGRAPVLYTDNNGNKNYWGLISSVIDIEQLLSKVDFNEGSLQVALRNSENNIVFWGNANVFIQTESAVLMPISFPGGGWDIVGVPRLSPKSHLDLPLAKPVHISLFILLLLLCAGYYHSHRRNLIIYETQENLRHAQNIAHLGNWKLDLASNRVWWSRECFKIFGLDPKYGAPSMDAIIKSLHPDETEMILEKLKASEQAGVPYAIDHRIILPDGQVRHVQARGDVQQSRSGKPEVLHGTVLDITERKIIEEALKASEQMMLAMAEASLDALVTLDKHDHILFWSPAAEIMFGWTKQEVIGQKLHQIIVPERFRDRAYKGLEKFCKTGDGPFIGAPQEVIAVRKDGVEFPADLSVAPFKLDDDFYAQGSIRDATKRKKNEKWLTYLANTDELTGLKNRRYFFERSVEEIKRSARYLVPLSVILLDIDRFKSINDTYGHETGDLVLKKLAEILNGVVREQDLASRHGGEEFTILLPHTDKQAAAEVAERLRRRIEENSIELSEGRIIRFTVSLGIAQLSENLSSLDQILSAADEALYEAKESGRNKVVLA